MAGTDFNRPILFNPTNYYAQSRASATAPQWGSGSAVRTEDGAKLNFDRIHNFTRQDGSVTISGLLLKPRG